MEAGEDRRECLVDRGFKVCELSRPKITFGAHHPIQKAVVKHGHMRTDQYNLSILTSHRKNGFRTPPLTYFRCFHPRPLNPPHSLFFFAPTEAFASLYNCLAFTTLFLHTHTHSHSFNSNHIQKRYLSPTSICIHHVGQDQEDFSDPF